VARSRVIRVGGGDFNPHKIRPHRVKERRRFVSLHNGGADMALEGGQREWRKEEERNERQDDAGCGREGNDLPCVSWTVGELANPKSQRAKRRFRHGILYLKLMLWAVPLTLVP